MTSERSARGFTLLEMLVVLLIAGMALALTSQALGQYRRANDRVAESTQAGREYRMAERWFRDSVMGLHAVDDSTQVVTLTREGLSPLAFRGDERGFSGFTLLPVLSGQGVPTRQSWTIEPNRYGQDTLALEEDGKRLTIPFPDTGLIQLSYLDAKGDTHSQWPPAEGEFPHLPAAVALTSSSGAVIVGAVTGPQDPVIMRYEPEPF